MVQKGSDIQRLDKTSILKICSAQVVIDLKSAVKELVENSLDAGSTTIGKCALKRLLLTLLFFFSDIKFMGCGLNGFEVTDNGKGIKEEDFEIIAKRGTTSKIREFEDIYSVKSLGFRGEALSSLCNIANVSILTKRAQDETGWCLKFDHMGTLISQEKVSKKNGTQVIVKGLFHDLPVRYTDFKKTHKSQYAKAVALMQSYAMIATQTKITVSNNQGDAMPFSNVLRTNVRPKPDGQLMNLLDEWDGKRWIQPFQDNIIAILGRQKFEKLVEFTADLPKVKIRGFLTRTVISGSVQAPKVNKEGTFCFLNSRPIDMPRKMKMLIMELYKQYNPAASVNIVWNILVEDNNYDINVSPDKREVYIKNENEVLTELKIQLTEFFEDIQRVKAYDASDQSLLKFQQSQAGNQSAVSKQSFFHGMESTAKKQPFEDVMSQQDAAEVILEKRTPKDINLDEAVSAMSFGNAQKANSSQYSQKSGALSGRGSVGKTQFDLARELSGVPGLEKVSISGRDKISALGISSKNDKRSLLMQDNDNTLDTPKRKEDRLTRKEDTLITRDKDGIRVKNYVPVISKPKIQTQGELSREMMTGRPGLSIMCYSNDAKKESKEQMA